MEVSRSVLPLGQENHVVHRAAFRVVTGLIVGTFCMELTLTPTWRIWRRFRYTSGFLSEPHALSTGDCRVITWTLARSGQAVTCTVSEWTLTLFSFCTATFPARVRAATRPPGTRFGGCPPCPRSPASWTWVAVRASRHLFSPDTIKLRSSRWISTLPTWPISDDLPKPSDLPPKNESRQRVRI